MLANARILKQWEESTRPMVFFFYYQVKNEYSTSKNGLLTIYLNTLVNS